MRRFTHILLLLPLAARGEERFPPPEFTSGYHLHQLMLPAARAAALGYLDAALLLIALLLAAYLIYRQRSRTGIFALTVVSLGYFGFYRHGCVCAVGSLQNVVYALGHHDYALPLVVAIFFLLPLFFTLIFGRVFCAAVCPLGAVQELVLLRPVKVPAWLEAPLRVLPYLYLGAGVLFAATGSAFLICQYDPFVGFFRQGSSLNLLLFGGAMLLLGVFVGRPYCR